MEERLQENLGIITEQELSVIKSSKILIVGLGGLGGNVANQLVRLGVKHLILIDFDEFDITNLNRQLFSNESNVGQVKVNVIKEQLLLINPQVTITTHEQPIEEIYDIVQQVDYIIDAVDNPKTKVFLNKIATAYNKPLLHGACAGWYGQVGWIEPECMLLKNLYEDEEHGLEKELRNPPFTPSFTASVMVSEFVKYVTNPSSATINELLLIDIKNSIMTKTGGSTKW